MEQTSFKIKFVIHKLGFEQFIIINIHYACMEQFELNYYDNK